VLGAILVNGATAVAIVTVMNRRGGRQLARWTVVALLLYLRVLGPILLHDVWNPYVTILPCLLFVLLLWSFACGDRWALPFAAAVASFLVQSHVGYLPVVAAGGATTVAVTAWSIHRGTDDSSWGDTRRPVLVAAVVGLVLWIPSIIEQLRHSPGNLTRIARFTSAHGFEQPWHALRDLWVSDTGAFAASLVGRHPKVGLDGADYFSNWPALVTVVVLALGLVLAIRHRVHDAIALGVFAIVFALPAMFAISHIVGGAFEYIHKWATLTGFFGFFLGGWMLCTLAWESERWSKRFDGVLAAIAVALVVMTSCTIATSSYPNAKLSADTVTVNAAVRRALASHPGARVTVQSAGGELSALLWVYSLADELDRHGISVFTFSPAADVLPARFRRLSPAPAVAITIVGDRDVAAFVAPGSRRIAHPDGISIFVSPAAP